MKLNLILRSAAVLSLSLAYINFALAKIPSSKPLQSPQVFILKQTEHFLQKAKSLPPLPQRNILVSPRASKRDWLEALYETNLVDASDYSEALSDKLLMTSLFERVLGETQARQFLPKTIGLKQFLERHQLVDSKGKLIADGDRIDSSLHQEFPTGFFVRPAVGITPYETENGMFKSQEQLIVELLKGKTNLYDPNTYWRPIKSHILNAVVSGEAVVLQENLTISAELKGRMQRKRPVLVRVHSYENKIVPNSLPQRWIQDEAELNEKQSSAAVQFAQAFLNSLPNELTHRQAWSLEVACFDNGTYRITNILTNRGRKIAWSTYLDQPQILRAYTNHLENHTGVEFEGMGARLIRWGFANYFTYWKLRIQKAQGWRKITAALPPLG